MRWEWLRNAFFGTLFVLGIAWTSIHLFVVFATPATRLVVITLSAIPYFLGLRYLAIGSTRAGAVFTFVGAVLMFGSDAYLVWDGNR